MRLFTPLLLLAVAVGIHVYNTGGHGEIIAFFFLDDLMPSLEGDLVGQGRVSAQICAILAVVLGLRNGMQALRERRRARAEED